jgi:hypothetical protein
MARSSKTIKGNIIKEYLDKFPTATSAALSRKILKENSLAFDGNVENVRTLIRYQRGSQGAKNRDKITNKVHFGGTPQNPFNIPESYEQKKEWYIIPKANNNILVISDLHIPYHSASAINAALQYGKDAKVNTIIILGDLIDFCTLSRFEKDPRARSVKEEFDITRAFLETLRNNFPDCKIIWLKGNHDVRYEKWLWSKAPEIFDDNYYKLEERLQLNNLKIELLEDTVLIKAGKLILTHGHLTIRGVFAPVNAARGVFIRAKSSVMIGHCHSVSEHTESNLKDEIISCWSIGCLCTLYQPYDPQNTKHSHGFSHITTETNGNYSVYNKRILNGKIL